MMPAKQSSPTEADRPLCPRCNSPDTVAYPFGTSPVADIYRRYYPNARKCVDCERTWW